MDPLILPILTEMQRRHKLELAFHAWRAGQKIVKMEREKGRLVYDLIGEVAGEHRRRSMLPEGEDQYPGWSPDEEFLDNTSMALQAAGPAISFQQMAVHKSNKIWASNRGVAHVCETLSKELWKEAFLNNFS